MTLSEKAILEIDGNLGEYDGKKGVFVLRENLEDSEETDIKHILGNRGQYVSELYDQISDHTELVEGPDQRDRRSGFHVDGGAGKDSWVLSARAGVDAPNEQWGDGSTDPNDPTDISKLDATGCEPVTKRDILGAWIAQNRLDSSSPARLYRGEWSDGTYADSPGVFGRPIPVVVQETRLERPEDESTFAVISITLVRTSKLSELEDAAEDIVDSLGGLIEDY